MLQIAATNKFPLFLSPVQVSWVEIWCGCFKYVTSSTPNKIKEKKNQKQK